MTPLGYSESITFCHSDNGPSQNLDLLVRQIVGTGFPLSVPLRGLTLSLLWA